MRDDRERRNGSSGTGGRRKAGHGADIPPHIDRRASAGLTGRRSTDPRSGTPRDHQTEETGRRDSRNEARR